MPQATFIEKLGGNKAVAELLGKSPGAVAMWRLRNCIPWKYRPALARIAAERAIPLPEDFWEEAAA